MGRLVAFLCRPRVLLLVAALVAVMAVGAVPAWAWYHYRAAEQEMQRYHSDPALEHVQQYLRIWPDSVPANLLAARAHRRAGRLAEAEKHIDRARQSADPEGSDAVAFEWALLRAALGDLASVEKSLQARAAQNPADAPLVWEALSVGYRRMYRMPEARMVVDTWLAIDGKNVQAWILRGEIFRQVGARGQALEAFQRVVELDAEQDAARRHLVWAQTELGHYRAAAENLDILLKKFPDDVNLRITRAVCKQHLNERDEAARILDEVLREHPDHGVALREQGRFALAAERFADAEKSLRHALRVLPHDRDTHWALHQALNNLGRTEDAEAERKAWQDIKDREERIGQILQAKMSDRPFDPALHAELGGLLIELGHGKAGRDWLLSAAHLYEQRGDTAKAQLHRKEAQRLQAGP